LEIARTYWSEKNAEAALQFVEEYIHKYPEASDIRPYSLRGEILFETKRYEEALKAFLEYREKFPGTPQIESLEVRIGECLLGLEEYEEAKNQLNQFLEAYPDSFFAGYARRLLGSIDEKQSE